MFRKKSLSRIFAVISLNAVLCSACTAVPSVTGKTANPMTGSFSADVIIQDTDTESKACLTRFGTNAWRIVFSEPRTLAGVQLDFLDDEVKASYKGLEFSVPQSAQTIRTEVGNLMEIIDDMALSPELNGKAEEDKIICEGAIEEGSYTMIFTDSGIPEEFSLPCYGVTVKFENFSQQTESISESQTEPATEPPVTQPEETQPAVLEETESAEPVAMIPD